MNSAPRLRVLLDPSLRAATTDRGINSGSTPPERREAPTAMAIAGNDRSQQE